MPNSKTYYSVQKEVKIRENKFDKLILHPCGCLYSFTQKPNLWDLDRNLVMSQKLSYASASFLISYTQIEPGALL